MLQGFSKWLEDLKNEAVKAVTPTVDTKGRGNLAYNIVQPFAQAQNFVESGQRFEAPYLQSNLNLTNPMTWNAENVGTTAANMGIGFLNNTVGQAANFGTDLGKIATKGIIRPGTAGITSYDQMKSPIFRLASQGIGAFDPAQAQAMRVNMTPQAVLGNIGEIASSAADMYAPGAANAIIRGTGNLIPRIISGAKTGAITGGIGMGGEGLYQGRDMALPDQLSLAGQYGALGVAGGGLLGGGAPIAGAAGKQVVKGLGKADDILRQTSFATHERQVVDAIRSIPGLTNALRADLQANGYKSGFATDMRRQFKQLGFPEAYQKLNATETRHVVRFLTGLSDTLPQHLQKKITDTLPKQSWGEVGGTALNRLKGEEGNASTELLTLGLDKQVAKLTTGRDLANKKLNIQKQDAAYIEQNFGRATTPKEQEQLFKQWEQSYKKETATPNQNLNRQNASIRGQNTDRKRLATELYKDDPMRAKGAKLPIKPGVNTSEAGFPSKALSAGGKDKAAFSYQRETLLRNIEETFGRGSEQTKQIKSYLFDPIIKNETSRTRMVNRIRSEMSDTMKQSGIKRSSKEDFAAADFIEGTLSADDLRAQFPNKADAIMAYAEKGRGVYKDLLTRTNEVLTKYGYDPIPERANYVTHTTQMQTFWEQMGSFLNMDKDKLPTAMAAIHQQTKPGKQFNPFAQRREGGSTHEGLATAMDKYLDVTTQQLFHTADVQRARAIQNYLGKQAASAGGDSTNLSNFTKYISQYADTLAGKKSVFDREMETLVGRGVYNAANSLRKRFGANAIGGSLSSAVTNFIPLTQTLATTNKIAATKGLLANFKFGDEAIIDGVESSFLRRRFPEVRIGGNAKTVVRDAVSGPFQLVDKFVSKTVVGGKFHEGLQKGLDPQTAMAQADEYAARAMSDRSLGQSPLLFNSQTMGLFTQFQNEVNNQVSFIMKDIPKNLDLNPAQVAASLTQIAVFSYLYNSVYEQMNGRRPAIDPIDTAVDALMGDWESVGENTLNAVPFASAVGGMFGLETGRIPMSGGIPDITNVVNDPVKELSKPLAYFAPPYAGGQVKKTLEGLGTYFAGGDTAKDGDQKFSVEPNAANFARSAVFGKWATPEAQEYINGIGKPKQSSTTATAGMDSDNATERLEALKEEKKRIEGLPEPGFLREGVTADERKSQLEAIDEQIAAVSTEAGWLTTINKLAKMRPDGALGQARFKGDLEKLGKDIGKAMLDGDVEPDLAMKYLNQLGISPQDVEYSLAKDLNTDEQAQYVWEALNKGADIGALAKADLLTTATAKSLAEQGLISWDQYDGLKDYLATAGGKITRPKAAKKLNIQIKRSAMPTPKLITLDKGKSQGVAMPKFARITA